MPFSASGHLEAELVALVAEVLRFAVHVVAVRAVKLVLIVRGDVRIRRLDVLRLLDEVLRVVALRARLDVGRGGIGLVGAVAGLAGETHRRMTVGTELLVGSLSGAEGERRGAERGEDQRRHLHFCFPFWVLRPEARSLELRTGCPSDVLSLGQIICRRAGVSYLPKYVFHAYPGMGFPVCQ